jgi:DNA-binding MarR family transcriptional regulator
MTMPQDPSDFPARLRRAVGRLSRRLRQTQAGAELTPSQYEVLVTLVQHSPLRHAELAALEGLNPTMLSRVVGKLETRGLATRLADDADGRVVHVGVTKEGRDLVARVRKERSDVLRAALGTLSDGDVRALEAALPALEVLAESLKGESA